MITNIRYAKHSDLNSIIKIIRLCANYMISDDIFQWNNTYPNKEIIQKDIEHNEMHVYETKSEIIGCIVISETKDQEYKSVKWLKNNDSCIYIHRLAVNPVHQNSGIGNKLMDYAENYARKKQLTSVRLDTFSKNLKNQKFYERRGYVKLESIYYPLQSDSPFYCYELLL